jgi:hypothetical protein
MTLLFRVGKSVKDKVILALGSSWPLNAKEILAHIKNNFGVNVTYQAVYKSINELLEEGVIIKSNDGYMLNREWLSALKEYTYSADRAYNMGISSGDVAHHEQVVVSSIWDWYSYVGTVMERLANDEYAIKTPVVIRGTHEWNGLIFGKEEFDRVQKIVSKYNIYTTVLIENSFAQSMANYWADMGINVAFLDKESFVETSSDMVVIGDYVIQAIFSKDLIKDMGRLYDSAMAIKDMDFSKLHKEVFFKKSDIHILTVKNKPLADKLRKETLEFFK